MESNAPHSSLQVGQSVSRGTGLLDHRGAVRDQRSLPRVTGGLQPHRRQLPAQTMAVLQGGRRAWPNSEAQRLDRDKVNRRQSSL